MFLPTNPEYHAARSQKYRGDPQTSPVLPTEINEAAEKTALLEKFLFEAPSVSTHPFKATPLLSHSTSHPANSLKSEEEIYITASSGSNNFDSVRNKPPSPPPKLPSSVKKKISTSKETEKTPQKPHPKPPKPPRNKASSVLTDYPVSSSPRDTTTTTTTTTTSTTTPPTLTPASALPSPPTPTVPTEASTPVSAPVNTTENVTTESSNSYDPSAYPPIESTAGKVMAYAAVALLAVGFIACLAAAPFTGGISLWAAPFFFFAALTIPVVRTFAEVETNQAVASLRQQLANVTPLKALEQKKTTLEEEIGKLEKKQANPKSPLTRKEKQELEEKNEELLQVTTQIKETKELTKKQENKRKATLDAEKAETKRKAEAEAKRQADIDSKKKDKT